MQGQDHREASLALYSVLQLVKLFAAAAAAAAAAENLYLKLLTRRTSGTIFTQAAAMGTLGRCVHVSALVCFIGSPLALRSVGPYRKLLRY